MKKEEIFYVTFLGWLKIHKYDSQMYTIRIIEQNHYAKPKLQNDLYCLPRALITGIKQTL